MSVRKIAKNYIWLTLGQFFIMAGAFITNVYLARVLTVSGYGLIGFTTAFLSYLMLVVDAGLSSYGTREIAKYKDHAAKIAVNIYFLRAMTAVILYSLSAAVIMLSPVDPKFKTLFLITFLSLFSSALSGEWLFKGIERMEFISVANISQASISVIFTLLFVSRIEDLIKVPFIMFISYIIPALILFFVAKKVVPGIGISKIDPGSWKGILSASVPYAFSLLLVQIYYNLDMIMLGFMKGSVMVGWYSASYKLFMVTMIFLSLWQSSIFPTVSRLFEENREHISELLTKYIHLTLLFTVPVAVAVTLMADSIVLFVFGSAYLPAAMALKILIWILIAVSVNGMLGALILFPAGKQTQVLYGTAIGAFCNIILNFMLIPTYGLYGASVATLITEIVVVFAMYHWATKLIRVPWGRFIIKPVIFSAISGTIGYMALAALLPYVLLWLISFFVLFSASYIICVMLFGEKDFIFSFVTSLNILNRKA